MELAALQLKRVDALLRQSGVRLSAPSEVGTLNYLQSVLDALCDLSSTDALTGLMNRRAFILHLEQEVDRVTRGGEYALLLAIDIDHFKQVNDNFGHAVGDVVLQAVTQRLRSAVRPMDMLARMGGEEFALLCPNCPPPFASALAERIRQAVSCTQIPIDAERTLPITASLGGAFALPWLKAHMMDWLKRADEQLYKAKQSGRDCVRLENVPHADVSQDEKRMLFAWSDDSEISGSQLAAPLNGRNDIHD